MRIRIIFLNNKPLSLECLNIMQDVQSKHYYEKVSADLYEYVQINKKSMHLLNKEVNYKWDKVILCVNEEMAPKEAEIMEEFQEKWPELLQVCYMPEMEAEEIIQMLPVFLSMLNKTKTAVYSLKGSTMILGHERIEEGTGKLVSRIFEKWQYMSKLNHIKINFYSWQEMGIVMLSQLEDIFEDYIGENAKLEMAWHKSQKETDELYFFIEGR